MVTLTLMKRFLVIALAIGLLQGAKAASESQTLCFRLAFEKETPNSSSMQLRGSSEAYFVCNTNSLDGEDLLSIKVDRTDELRWHMVVTIKAAAAEKLHQVTAAHIGERLGVVVEGKLLSAPIIREAISGNEINISGGSLSTFEIEAIAKRIRDAIAACEPTRSQAR